MDERETSDGDRGEKSDHRVDRGKTFYELKMNMVPIFLSTFLSRHSEKQRVLSFV